MAPQITYGLLTGSLTDTYGTREKNTCQNVDGFSFAYRETYGPLTGTYGTAVCARNVFSNLLALTATLTVDLRALTVTHGNRLLQPPQIETYLVTTYGSLTDTYGCAGKMTNKKTISNIHLRDALTGTYGSVVAA